MAGGEHDVVKVVFREMAGPDETLSTSLVRRCLMGCGFSVEDGDFSTRQASQWRLEDVMQLASDLKKQGRWALEGNIAKVPLNHVLVWVKVYASLSVAASDGNVTVGALKAVLTSGPQPLTSGAWSDVCQQRRDEEYLSLCHFLQMCKVF
jgi:hypothetical protein